MLDTIGELAGLFQVATVVFVGGSLVNAGGHNILEPAVFGKPILFGPHMQNFAEIASTFLANDAAVQVQRRGRARGGRARRLLDDPVRRASLGAAARALVEANRGARERTLDALERAPAARSRRGAACIPSAGRSDADERRIPPSPIAARPLAGPLSAVYARGGRWRSAAAPAHGATAARARHRAWGPRRGRQRQDAAGRATWRGLLRDAGERPAILSRGYARAATRTASSSCSDGASLRADLARSGDEPLLLARALPAWRCSSCADRYLAGCLAESRLGCTVHVLDDGFQHHGLASATSTSSIVSAADVEHGRVLPAGTAARAARGAARTPTRCWSPEGDAARGDRARRRAAACHACSAWRGASACRGSSSRGGIRRASRAQRR